MRAGRFVALNTASRRSHRRLVACLGGLTSGHHGRGLDVPCGCILQVDAVVLQGGGQNLVEAGAVLGIGGVGGDQVVLSRGKVALLKQDIGRGGCAQVQLLDFRVEALLVIVPGGSGACTCARSLVSANCAFTTCMRICV